MNTIPPAEPGRHGINELLALVGEIRRLAFGNLPPIEALGRIRDAFHEYDLTCVRFSVLSGSRGSLGALR
jgi:hypothetical protein